MSKPNNTSRNANKHNTTKQNYTKHNTTKHDKTTATIKQLQQELENLEKIRRLGNIDKNTNLTPTILNTNIKNLKQKITTQKQNNKKLAMQLEKRNYQYLVIFDSDHHYAKVAGNSALFYTCNVAQRIGRRATLRADSDHYFPSQNGVVSLKYDQNLITKLKNINLALDQKLSTDQVHVFKFPQTFSDQDLTNFRDRVTQDERRINQAILPTSPIPTLFVYLSDLTEIIYYGVAKMSPIGREALGNDILRLSITMLKRYIENANRSQASRDHWQRILNGAVEIKNSLKAVQLLHLMDNHRICRILEQALNIQKLTTRLIKENRKKSQESKNAASHK